VEIPVGHAVEVDAAGSASRAGHGLASGLVSTGLHVGAAPGRRVQDRTAVSGWRVVAAGDERAAAAAAARRKAAVAMRGASRRHRRQRGTGRALQLAPTGKRPCRQEAATVDTAVPNAAARHSPRRYRIGGSYGTSFLESSA
jgi:hypothetical protein